MDPQSFSQEMPASCWGARHSSAEQLLPQGLQPCPTACISSSGAGTSTQAQPEAAEVFLSFNTQAQPEGRVLQDAALLPLRICS